MSVNSRELSYAAMRLLRIVILTTDNIKLEPIVNECKRFELPGLPPIKEVMGGKLAATRRAQSLKIIQEKIAQRNRSCGSGV